MSSTTFFQRLPGSGLTYFKMIIYTALAVNVYRFWAQDQQAVDTVLVNGIAFGQVVQYYAATIDTAAWLALILIFEMETAVLDDRWLERGGQWLMLALRVLLYGFVCYACWGYIATLLTISQYEHLPGIDVCALVGTEASFLPRADDYLPLAQEHCEFLADKSVYRIIPENAYFAEEKLANIVGMAWADVVNGVTWILVVLVLEIEVRLQLNNQLSDRKLKAFSIGKSALYLILFAVVIYWSIEGQFLLDFYDGILWLLGFFLIELNMFDWQKETHRQASANQKSQSAMV